MSREGPLNELIAEACRLYKSAHVVMKVIIAFCIIASISDIAKVVIDVIRYPGFDLISGIRPPILLMAIIFMFEAILLNWRRRIVYVVLVFQLIGTAILGDYTFAYPTCKVIRIICDMMGVGRGMGYQLSIVCLLGALEMAKVITICKMISIRRTQSSDSQSAPKSGLTGGESS